MKTLFLLVFTIYQFSWSHFLPIEQRQSFPISTPRTPKHLMSRELGTAALNPIFRQTQPGVYLSTGTERAFMGAAASNATHLLVIDKDPDVIKYNKILMALIIASESPEHLLELKKAKNFASWREASSNLFIHPKLAEFLSIDYFLFYQRSLLSQSQHFQQADLMDYYFRESPLKDHLGNYILSEYAYFKLKGMILNRRIQFVIGDLSDEAFMKLVKKEIRALNLEVTIIDIGHALNNSNQSIPPYKLAATLKNFANSKPILIGNTQFRTTSFFASKDWHFIAREDNRKLQRFFTYLSYLEAFHENSEIDNTHYLNQRRDYLLQIQSELGISQFTFQTSGLNEIQFNMSCNHFFN